MVPIWLKPAKQPPTRDRGTEWHLCEVSWLLLNECSRSSGVLFAASHRRVWVGSLPYLSCCHFARKVATGCHGSSNQLRLSVPSYHHLNLTKCVVPIYVSLGMACLPRITPSKSTVPQLSSPTMQGTVVSHLPILSALCVVNLRLYCLVPLHFFY